MCEQNEMNKSCQSDSGNARTAAPKNNFREIWLAGLLQGIVTLIGVYYGYSLSQSDKQESDTKIFRSLICSEVHYIQENIYKLISNNASALDDKKKDVKGKFEVRPFPSDGWKATNTLGLKKELKTSEQEILVEFYGILDTINYTANRVASTGISYFKADRYRTRVDLLAKHLSLNNDAINEICEKSPELKSSRN